MGESWILSRGNGRVTKYRQFGTAMQEKGGWEGSAKGAFDMTSGHLCGQIWIGQCERAPRVHL